MKLLVTSDKIKVPIKYSFFILALYVYIYNPPIAVLPIMPIEILLLISFAYLTINNKWLKLISALKVESLIYFLIVLYCFFREFGSGGSSVFFKANLFFLFQCLILPYFLVDWYARFRGHNNLLKDIILIGVIAAFTSVVMIFIPSLGEVIRYQILKTDEYTDLLTFRNFGIAEGLTFAYGTVQGIIFALILFYARNNSKYYWLLPIVLLSVIFNARIGLVPVIFSLFYFIVIKFNIKLVSIIAIVSLVFYFVVFNTPFFSEYAETIEWAFRFFTESSDFVTGNDSSSYNTFDTLFGKMAVFPTDLRGWLIGTGENIFLAAENNSDIGYLIQLNYGGMLYMLLLFSLVGYMMFRLKFIYKYNRWLIFLFIVTIIISNVKGLFISIIPSFRLLALIYCYFIIEYKMLRRYGEGKFDLKSLTNFNKVDNG